jgi:putative glutathione S-transferase
MQSNAKAQFPDEASAAGDFVRQGDAFRNWVRADGSSRYAVEAGRYHLYVSLACPWAHRTIIARELLGLEGAIGMTVVDPIRDERGWAFGTAPGLEPDPVNGFAFLSEAYLVTDPTYRGRVTVPVLWDKHTGTLVSNSDDDILRMFETEFAALGTAAYDLYPAALRAEIEALNDRIYNAVNDGVYRAGFATSQHAYEAAVKVLFRMLDELDARLATTRYLFGSQIVETDLRLFVTLIRFDAVYYGHFKCNLLRIVDYRNLWGYLRDVYAIPGIASTVNFDHIKRHYYMTHDEINPTRIVPLGPILDLSAPHGRETLGADRTLTARDNNQFSR